jgi:hypothetical protein
MSFLAGRRWIAVVAGFGVALLVAAGWGGWRADAEPTATLAGPVVSMWVVDHGGIQPEKAELAAYQTPFDRVLRGCRISPADLASVVFTMSDRASLGSGVEMNNLRVLRGIASEVGETKVVCDETFFRAEAHLIGSALD